MAFAVTRRSDRVSIAVPVQVYGTAVTGEAFMEQTQTQLLSRHGAALLMTRKMLPQEQIIIRNLANQREAVAQIVGQMGAQDKTYIYGVAFLDPEVNLWDINFLRLSSVEEATLRLVLECKVCSGQEPVLLKDFESDVFGASQNLTRDCRRCREATQWFIAAQEPIVGQLANDKMRQPSPYGAHPGSQNDRKNPRLKLNISACVRLPGFNEQEIVEVENVSRGGLSFLSARSYFSGSILEVAAPYTRDATNVFVRSRLISIQSLPGTVRKRYGVGYLQNSYRS
jgi:hypothetical protein